MLPLPFSGLSELLARSHARAFVSTLIHGVRRHGMPEA